MLSTLSTYCESGLWKDPLTYLSALFQTFLANEQKLGLDYIYTRGQGDLDFKAEYGQFFHENLLVSTKKKAIQI